MAYPFASTGNTASISVTSTTSAATQINSSGARVESVRIYNSGTEAVFLAFGGPSVTAATATGMPIGPGVTEVFGVYDDTHIAAITVGAGPTTLYLTPGVGS